jgi:hypothetical protein
VWALGAVCGENQVNIYRCRIGAQDVWFARIPCVGEYVTLDGQPRRVTRVEHSVRLAAEAGKPLPMTFSFGADEPIATLTVTPQKQTDNHANTRSEKLYRHLASSSISQLVALVWFATRRGSPPKQTLCARLFERGLIAPEHSAESTFSTLTGDGRSIIEYMVEHKCVPVKAVNYYGMPEL